MEHLLVIHNGDPENKDLYRSIGVSWQGVEAGLARPSLSSPDVGGSGSCRMNSNHWENRIMADLDWDGVYALYFFGTNGEEESGPMLAAYAADLYLNNQLAAELTLLPVKGGLDLD